MKTALIFSGQGAQYPGMMRDIADQFPAAKEVFGIASHLLGQDIYSLTMDSTQEQLDQTENTQPCLLTCELAALRAYQELGLPYDAAVGFSLGEWAALAASGAASVEDVLSIISKRAAAMQRAVPPGGGGMVVILGKDEAFTADLCQSIGGITPANYNCPGNITAAGSAAACEKLLEIAGEQGITAVKVAVSIPSHCALMAPAAEELTPVIQRLAVQKPKTRLVMNATGRPADSEAEIKENLIRQLVNPVLFQQSIEYLLEQDYDVFVEIGPGKTLSKMIRRTAKKAGIKVKIMQLNCAEDIDSLTV